MGSPVPASKSPGPARPAATSISLSLTVSQGQVNQEIYSEEDLLAIDSEISNTVAIAPPPDFHSNSLESELEVDQKTKPDGSHSFSYSLPDGTRHSQSGYFSQNGYVMKGFWEYFGPDGNLYRTEFTADEMGYRPKIIKMKARMSRNLSLSKNKRKKYGSFKLNKKRKAGGKS